MKVQIDERYFKEEELYYDNLPYKELLNCIDSVLPEYNSIFDAGCRNGKFLQEVYYKHKHVCVKGCDYFQWAIDASHNNIKKYLYRFDLRDSIEETEKYDLVISTEVAEHIDKDYCSVYINNLKKLMKKYLIITWSSTGGKNDKINDAHIQHLNPLSKSQYHSLLETNGLKYETDLSNKLVYLMQQNKNIYFYWTNTIGIFSL